MRPISKLTSFQKKKHHFLEAHPTHVVAIFATFASLQGILSIPIHAFATSVQINHFCDFRYNWMKMKMKNTFISSIFSGIPK
jgi:hypothetical protein